MTGDTSMWFPLTFQSIAHMRVLKEKAGDDTPASLSEARFSASIVQMLILS